MNEKEKADIWIEQYKASWTNFHQRRQYEWKFCFSLWGMLVILLALIIKKEIPPLPISKHIFFICALFVISLHSYFLYCVKLAFIIDQEIAKFYENKLNELTGLPKWDSEEGQKEKEIRKINKFRKRLKRRGHKGWWSVITQLLITILLILLIYMFNYPVKVEDSKAETKMRQNVKIQYIKKDFQPGHNMAFAHCIYGHKFKTSRPSTRIQYTIRSEHHPFHTHEQKY